MADNLARQAAERIAQDEGWEPESKLDTVVAAINSVGELVPPDAAALLAQMLRLQAVLVVSKPWARLDGIDYTVIDKKWKVAIETDKAYHCGSGDTLAAALASALDEMGVPPATT